MVGNITPLRGSLIPPAFSMFVEPAQTEANESRAPILIRLVLSTAYDILDLMSGNMAVDKVSLYLLTVSTYAQGFNGSYECILIQSILSVATLGTILVLAAYNKYYSFVPILCLQGVQTQAR